MKNAYPVKTIELKTTEPYCRMKVIKRNYSSKCFSLFNEKKKKKKKKKK